VAILPALEVGKKSRRKKTIFFRREDQPLGAYLGWGQEKRGGAIGGKRWAQRGKAEKRSGVAAYGQPR